MILIGKSINQRYTIIDKIAEGGMSTVWLAKDEIKKDNVAVKILKKQVTSSRIQDIIRFKNEAGTVSKLDIPGVVKLFEIGEMEDMHYIIMEFIRGKSLHHLIDEGMKFDIQEAVDLAYKICDTLKHIHNANIIHRDLKAGNIILKHGEHIKKNPQIKLIDFGLAQMKDYEMINIGELVGTVSYMSPEQTGAIRRKIDERSDLYSLGVIFYQLLTGNLPFKGSGIHSVIYKHISEMPDALIKYNPDIPPILERMILKLLEKEPEKRYQSAEGLLKDLDRIRKGDKDFTLGIDDRYIKLNYRTELVGRERELVDLKKMFDEALMDKGSMCLIAGEAGRGKTRLVEEFKACINEKNGVLLTGKCFSGRGKMPYGPFNDAINLYIRNFGKYSDRKKELIRTHIKKELQELGGVLLKLNPMLKEVIGDYPPLIELEADSENKRFLMVISNFFYALARIENSLVIVLEDLHWCDEGSIELLSVMTKEIKKYPIVVIGTYRDNEVDENHCLSKCIKLLNNEKNPFYKIWLKPFDTKRMNSFIAGLLFDTEENTTTIADYIMYKSKGNPFFAIEILKRLIEEKAVIQKKHTWVINEEILSSMEVSSSIVDILMMKISYLERKEIDILSYVALIGKQFDIGFLFELAEFPKEEIVNVIDKAIDLQLLEEDMLNRGKIRFIHDRIREAFYGNIKDEDKMRLQYKIAKTLEETHKQNIDNVIFDLFHYYLESGDKEKVLSYAYRAGIIARENYVNEDAVEYFYTVIKILDEKGKVGSEVWVESMENIGEIYLIIGRTNEAIELFNRLLPYVKTKLKKCNAFKQISYAYFKKGDWRSCEEYCKLGLEVVGERFPGTGIGIVSSLTKEMLWHFLYSFIPSNLVNRKAISTNEEVKTKIWLYYLLTRSYVLGGSHVAGYSTLRMLNFSRKRVGKSKELALSILTYANYLSEKGCFKKGIKAYNRALHLREQVNDEWGIAQSFYNMGFYYRCIGDYSRAKEFFDKSTKVLKKIGDIGELSSAISGLAGIYINISDYDAAKELNDQYYEICRRSKDNFGILVYWMHTSCYCLERGEVDDAESYGIKGYQLALDEKNWYSYCMMGIALGRVYIEKEEIDKAIEYLEIAKKLYTQHNFLKECTNSVFAYLAEAYILKYFHRDGKVPVKEANNYLKEIKKLCETALKETKGWETNYVLTLRVYAKYCFLSGDNNKAERLLMDSIRLCKRIGKKYELAKGFYEYGKYMDETGRVDESKRNYQAAYQVFREIGAKGYEKKLSFLLGQNLDSQLEGQNKESAKAQRLTNIINLGQTISSILDLNELYKKVISIAVEVTSAQRGYLIIKDGSSYDFKVVAGLNMNEKDTLRDDFSKSIINDVLIKGQAILSINALEDKKLYNYQSVLENELKSVLCIPIKYNNEIKGACYIDNTITSAAFTKEDIDVLNVIMVQTAISMENARLYQMAVTDGLTGFVIYKQLIYLLQKEVDKALNRKQCLSFMLIDVDNMKYISDVYGYRSGDQVLVRVSEIIKECVKISGLIGKYSGEEIAVILPVIDNVGAEIMAEEIRRKIEEEQVTIDGKVIQVTVSIGVVSLPYHSLSSEIIMKYAVEALQVSKKNGKNRITVLIHDD